ncbi:unnamed protein product [Pedinophyceae sp. YPF-701]|nr:unnamed protein product [Pedinophyceae sp. YPF-701]
MWDTLLATRQRRVVTFGAPDSKALGRFCCIDGSPDDPTSAPRSILEAVVVKQVSAGDRHGAALDAQGQLYVWGENDQGQLGIKDVPPPGFSPRTPFGSMTKAREPVDLECAYPCKLRMSHTVSLVACGHAFTLAALTRGGLIGWGCNAEGQLGLPTNVTGSVVREPKVCGPLYGMVFTSLAAARSHAAAVDADGKVWTWGQGKLGRLGQGNGPEVLRRGVPPGNPLGPVAERRARQVACGGACTFIVDAEGSVWSCGYNGCGALGHWDGKDRMVPARIIELPPVKHVAAAGVGMAVTVDGRLWMWGQSPWLLPKLKRGKVTAPHPPYERKDLPPGRVVHASCSGEHAAIVTDRGHLVVWGSGKLLPPSVSAGGDGPLSIGETLKDGVATVCCGSTFTVALCHPSKFNMSAETLELLQKSLYAWFVRSNEDAGARSLVDEGTPEEVFRDLPMTQAVFTLLCKEAGLITNATGYGEAAFLFDSGTKELESNQYEMEGNKRILFPQFTSIMLKLASLMYHELPRPVGLRRLYQEHISRLSKRPPSGPSSIMRSAVHPSLLSVLDHVSLKEIVQQCFAYSSFMAGDPSALLLNVRDSSKAMKDPDEGRFASAPPHVVGRLLRSAGVLSNTMLGMVGELTEFMQLAPLLGPRPPNNAPMAEGWYVEAMLIILLFPYPGLDIPVGVARVSEAGGEERGVDLPLFQDLLILCSILHHVQTGGAVEGIEDVGGMFSSLALVGADEKERQAIEAGDEQSEKGSVSDRVSFAGSALSARGATTGVGAQVKLTVSKLHRWRDAQRDPGVADGKGVKTDAMLEDEVDTMFHLFCIIDEQVEDVFMDRDVTLAFCKEAKLMDARFTQTHFDRIWERIAVPQEWHPAARAAGQPRPAVTKKTRLVLYRPEFTAILEKIGLQKQARARAAKQAYRLLVKRHVVPLRQAKLRRLDRAIGALLHPDVNEVLEEYEPALKETYAIYSMMDEELGWDISWDRIEEAAESMSILELTALATNFKLVPTLLSQKELDLVFRKVNYGPGSDDDFTEMSYDEFVDAVGLIAYLGFSKDPEFAKKGAADMVKALFDMMNLTPGEIKKYDPDQDPYYEWKSLDIDYDAAEHLGGHKPILILEVVSPPDVWWPDDVADVLAEALNAHRRGDSFGALQRYKEAMHRWERIATKIMLTLDPEEMAPDQESEAAPEEEAPLKSAPSLVASTAVPSVPPTPGGLSLAEGQRMTVPGGVVDTPALQVPPGTAQSRTTDASPVPEGPSESCAEEGGSGREGHELSTFLESHAEPEEEEGEAEGAPLQAVAALDSIPGIADTLAAWDAATHALRGPVYSERRSALGEQPGNTTGTTVTDVKRRMLTEVRVYFSLVMGCVLQQESQDRAALDVLTTAAKEAESLPEHHELRMTVPSIEGCSYYHRGQMRQAYRSLVQARVERAGAKDFGPSHLHTAVVSHNLGCCLSRLGKYEKALDLLTQAEQVLSRELGANHPRAALALRNLAQIRQMYMGVMRDKAGRGAAEAGGGEEGAEGEEGEDEGKEGKESRAKTAFFKHLQNGPRKYTEVELSMAGGARVRQQQRVAASWKPRYAKAFRPTTYERMKDDLRAVARGEKQVMPSLLHLLQLMEFDVPYQWALEQIVMRERKTNRLREERIEFHPNKADFANMASVDHFLRNMLQEAQADAAEDEDGEEDADGDAGDAQPADSPHGSAADSARSRIRFRGSGSSRGSVMSKPPSSRAFVAGSRQASVGMRSQRSMGRSPSNAASPSTASKRTLTRLGSQPAKSARSINVASLSLERPAAAAAAKHAE